MYTVPEYSEVKRANCYIFIRHLWSYWKSSKAIHSGPQDLTTRYLRNTTINS